MRRLANAAEALGLCLLAGAAFGLVEGLFAPPHIGESLAQRLLVLVLLDLLAVSPLGLALALLATLLPRTASPRRALWTLLGLPLLLLFSRGLPQEEARVSWILEQPLPYLRVDPEAPGAPPIVLITVDTVRADAELPLLAARARSATVFTQARSLAPWTLPSMASLHTGLPPGEHGAGARLDSERPHLRAGVGPVPTLAERLRERGYVNAAVLTNPYLSPRYGLHRGFDRYVDLSRRALLLRGLRRSALWRMAAPQAEDDPTDRALQLASRLYEGRYLLWVHYIEPHAPYTRLEGDPNEDCGLPDCYPGWTEPGPEEQIRALYAADVSRLDRQLDRLLGGLEELGVFDRALVVVVADHGEELWDHGGTAHGHSFYDELLRVPLVVWAPGQPGGVDERPVDLAGLHQAMLDWADTGRFVLESARATQAASLLFGPETSACIAGAFKAVEGLGVFDLAADPLERRPLPWGTAPEAERCLPGPMPAGSGPAEGDLGVLRALGYIE